MSAAPDPSPRLAVADVPASRGLQWLGTGFAIFRGQPLAWVGLAMGWLVVTLGLALVPLVGGVAASLLQPVFFASFVLAAQRQLADERPQMGDLFLGFRGNIRALLNLGAVLMLARLAIVMLMGALGLPSTLGPPGATVSPDEVMQALDGKMWIVAVGFLLVTLLTGATWFAPALIAFHGLSASHALRWSLFAALSNVGALLVYGFALTVMFFVAMIPWGLGLFVALPLMLTSTYVGYREVFEPPGAPVVPHEPAA